MKSFDIPKRLIVSAWVTLVVTGGARAVFLMICRRRCGTWTRSIVVLRLTPGRMSIPRSW